MIILGAQDVEAKFIEQMCREHGVPVGYALHGGERVNPRTAYRTEAYEFDGEVSTHWDRVTCMVECRAHDHQHIRYIDHHFPGDAGYGQPPENYWEASSIGQVAKFIGCEPTLTRRLVAAADHCLEAAYRGRCPGVDPAELLKFRAAEKAAHRGCTVDDVLADIDAAIERLERAPTWPRFVERTSGYPVVTRDLPYWVPWVESCDVRRRCYAAVPDGEHDPDGYIIYSGPPMGYTGGLGCYDEGDCHPVREWEIDGKPPEPWHYLRDLRGEVVPELPEAACYLGVPYLATPEPGKVTLGAAPPELVRLFMDGKIMELSGIYGDPARGFAGGYLTS